MSICQKQLDAASWPFLKVFVFISVFFILLPVVYSLIEQVKLKLITNSQQVVLPHHCSYDRAWLPLSSQPASPASGVQADREHSHCSPCIRYLEISLGGYVGNGVFVYTSYHCTWCCCWSSGPEAGMLKYWDWVSHLLQSPGVRIFVFQVFIFRIGPLQSWED